MVVASLGGSLGSFLVARPFPDEAATWLQVFLVGGVKGACGERFISMGRLWDVKVILVVSLKHSGLLQKSATKELVVSSASGCLILPWTIASVGEIAERILFICSSFSKAEEGRPWMVVL